MQKQHAFTLIEALMVLCVISIMLAISVPTLRHFLDNTNEQVLQSQLQKMIEFAQEQAHALRMPVTICKSKNHIDCAGNWSDGWLVFIDENKDGVVRDSEQIISVMQPGSQHGNLKWRSFPRYYDYLLFTSATILSGNNGTFWHCHDGSHAPIWAMMLSQSGKTRLAYPDKNGVIKDGHGKLLECN